MQRGGVLINHPDCNENWMFHDVIERTKRIQYNEVCLYISGVKYSKTGDAMQRDILTEISGLASKTMVNP